VNNDTYENIMTYGEILNYLNKDDEQEVLGNTKVLLGIKVPWYPQIRITMDQTITSKSSGRMGRSPLNHSPSSRQMTQSHVHSTLKTIGYLILLAGNGS
jgi:hypothetical protein